MNPRQSPTTHTEQLGDEVAVYDRAHTQVHALNRTAACVWRRCDGATSPEAIAAALRRELGISEADAVVDLTLRQLARVHLLELPIESRGDRPATTRRWLLGRGLAAAMLPAIYSIVAPSPVEAQSPPPGGPTLTSLSPNQGTPGTTVAVTLTGTNFVAGATTVTVGGSGVTVMKVAGAGVKVANVTVSSPTSLTANFVIDPTAAAGARTVTVMTAVGTSGPRIFTINPQPPGAPTLTSVTPNEGIQGTTVAVTLTGTGFVAGATTVAVAGGGVTVNNIVVSNGTSLTANFVLDPAAATGARSVTVTTAAGTSGAQTFTINLPPGPGTPTLTSVSPNQGLRGTTVAVTLTGTNFVVGATTVTITGGGVTVNTVVVGSTTSLTANFVLDPADVVGPRIVRVTTAGGTSAPQGFTISLPPPTLTSISPNQGIRGETVIVTLTGTNFVAGATTVAVAGGGVTVTNVVVGSSTSLTASFVLDATASGPRTVTVTTAGGTSGAQTFTVTLPPPGSQTFPFTGGPQTFAVPAGVVSITVVATGAQGGAGSGTADGVAGLGGRTTATVSVTPGASLTVLVGGAGAFGIGGGGFNGGGVSTGFGGGGGGGSSVRDGATPLVVVGGGGGAGAGETGVPVGGGNGGAGGDLIADDGVTVTAGGRGGGGGTQAAGGAGGTGADIGGVGPSGTAGVADTGGIGGRASNGLLGGGGGGGGYFGGGGGGCGNESDAGGGGGGGGSSFAAPGATAVVHQKGINSGNGSVMISW